MKNHGGAAGSGSLGTHLKKLRCRMDAAGIARLGLCLSTPVTRLRRGTIFGPRTGVKEKWIRRQDDRLRSGCAVCILATIRKARSHRILTGMSTSARARLASKDFGKTLLADKRACGNCPGDFGDSGRNFRTSDAENLWRTIELAIAAGAVKKSGSWREADGRGDAFGCAEREEGCAEEICDGEGREEEMIPKVRNVQAGRLRYGSSLSFLSFERMVFGFTVLE